MQACLTALLALLVATAGCARHPRTATVLRDDAHVFNKKETPRVTQEPKALSGEKELAVVLRSVPGDSIPAIALSPYFDQVFEKDSEWPKIAASPRWWEFGRKIKKHPPENALEIIVIANPKFLAWRFGSEAGWRAFISGLVLSDFTLEIQKRAQSGDAYTGVEALIGEFRKSFPTRSDLSWLQRFVAFEYAPDIQQIVDSVTLNDWHWYNTYVLKPVLQLEFGN